MGARRPVALSSPEVTVHPEPGTYALFCWCHQHALIEVGRLRRLHLQPGFYVYVGSSLGPGCLRSRLAHHEEPSKKPHWQIDYLRAHTQPQPVWYTYGLARREHQRAMAMRAVLDQFPDWPSADRSRTAPPPGAGLIARAYPRTATGRALCVKWRAAVALGATAEERTP
jgi:Uri superfamily endonuclease